ncbi:hypothetical protein HPB47_006833 [Ixodes persulcatus]|uniref:Uncharacterized protein n=1 Tax=Ixodes persulcatus TaxID=34615 RepID=A0AC60P9P3_IXOPE|nr:hypothetical protein HPB47_006833 [Ixodes persulcatus]
MKGVCTSILEGFGKDHGIRQATLMDVQAFLRSRSSRDDALSTDKPDARTVQRAAELAEEFATRRALDEKGHPRKERAFTPGKRDDGRWSGGRFSRDGRPKGVEGENRKEPARTKGEAGDGADGRADHEKKKSFEARRPLTCYNCQTPGHVAAGCREPKVVFAYVNDGEENLRLLEPYLRDLTVNGRQCRVLRDSAATMDVIHSSYVDSTKFTGECAWIKQVVEEHSVCLPIAKVRIEGPFGALETEAAVSAYLPLGYPYLFSNSTASTEDTDETELDKYQVVCLGHVKISSCFGLPSREKERKKNQRKGSVLRSGPYTSDKERHRSFGNCTSWKKLSTRRRGRGRGVVQQEKPSTVGDSDQGGPSRNTEEPECYRADPKRVHRETSARLRRCGSKIKNSDAEMGPSSRRTERRRKRLRRIRVLRFDNEASGKKRHLKLEKCTHKKKLLSRRGDGEFKDIHRQESLAYNISTSRRAAGDTNESRPDETGSRQKQPDKRRNSSKRSSKGKKRSKRSSDSTQTSSTWKEEDNSWDAGALRGKSSISSRYTGRQRHLFNLPPVITSDLKIKSGLPDCDFKSRIKSSEKDLESFSGTKKKRGVG